MPIHLPSLLIAILLLVPSKGQSAHAQDVDARRQTVDLMVEAANRICGTTPASGEYFTEVRSNVKLQLRDLSRRLTDSGVSNVQNLNSDVYQDAIGDQVAATISNNAQCRLEVLKSLINAQLPERAPSRTFVATRESGWRGGGYDPVKWCNDFISILRGENPQGQFTVKESSERSESRCKPFNCPQYNYRCSVQVVVPDAR
ncbi:hypothetical protein [Methylorubrum extorquens]